MPGNPKYDQFHKVKGAPKLGKSTEHDQNLIISEGGQEWGYISKPKLGPFLPCVLKKRCRNLAFDQFHNTKMAPKRGKSTDCNQNLISSEGGQDTSACQNSGHFSHAFSRKRHRNLKFDQFHYAKVAPKKENQQTVTKISSVRKVVWIHQHAKIQATPPMHSLWNAWKPPNLPVSRSQSGAKRRKINRQWPKSIRFWR